MSIEQLNQPADIVQLLPNKSISNLMYIIWNSRKDLQQAFDLNLEEGQKCFCHWYEVSIQREYGLSPLEDNSKCLANGSTNQSEIISADKTHLYTRLLKLERTVAKVARSLPAPLKRFGKLAWYYLLSLVARRAGSNCDKTISVNKPNPIDSVASVGGRYGANLIGYVHAELGMGEHVRMTATALDTTKTQFNVVNFKEGVPGRQKANFDDRKIVADNIYRTNVFHVNADQMINAYISLGRDFFLNRYNIGYWAWELAKCPEEWVPILSMVDEIWAPSRFIQCAFSDKTSKPVEYMPLCVSLPEFPRLTRKYFNLLEDAYLFLYTFDFYSYIDRKNPFAAIDAFLRAFPSTSSKVGLVLKVMNGDEKNPKWKQMTSLINNDPRIIVINKTLDRGEVLALFATCDSFVSLHRSEGFGRGPAEAMYLGKPVIVTGYSGNTDFTRPDNSCLVDYQLVPVEKGQYIFEEDQVWAEADIEQAAWYMKKLASDAGYAKDIGLKGKQTIVSEFSPSVIGQIYQKQLGRIDRLTIYEGSEEQ